MKIRICEGFNLDQVKFNQSQVFLKKECIAESETDKYFQS